MDNWNVYASIQGERTVIASLPHSAQWMTQIENYMCMHPCTPDQPWLALLPWLGQDVRLYPRAARKVMRALRHMDELGYCNDLYDALEQALDQEADWVGWGKDEGYDPCTPPVDEWHI